MLQSFAAFWFLPSKTNPLRRHVFHSDTMVTGLDGVAGFGCSESVDGGDRRELRPFPAQRVTSKIALPEHRLSSAPGSSLLSPDKRRDS
jgi:hypothetical protein